MHLGVDEISQLYELEFVLTAKAEVRNLFVLYLYWTNTHLVVPFSTARAIPTWVKYNINILRISVKAKLTLFVRD